MAAVSPASLATFARRRLCAGHQEPRLLRGIRRLRPGPGSPHRRRRGGGDGRHRGGAGPGHRPGPDRSQLRSGISQAEVRHVDTSKIDSAGSTSASRQTQLSGGATLEAATQLRQSGSWTITTATTSTMTACGGAMGCWSSGRDLGEEGWEETVTFRHPPTTGPGRERPGCHPCRLRRRRPSGSRRRRP